MPSGTSATMGSSVPHPRNPRMLARRIAIHTASAAFAWLVLTGANPAYMLTGIPVALLTGIAVAFSVPRMPGGGISPIAGLLWLPIFVWQTLIGALDVARRVLSPSLPIAPHFVDHQMSVPNGWPRAAFTGVISLTPGSLAAGAVGDRLVLHLLSDDPHLIAAVEKEERRIAKVAGGRHLRET
jgi:multicomponent Na+:H+ antiporter subunit E